MLHGGGQAAAHLRARCNDIITPLRSSKQAVVQHLRHLTATSLMQWKDMDFLNFLVCACLQEQTRTWRDGWSPTQLLRAHTFDGLIGCDAVRAVGVNPSPGADSGDIIIALTRTTAQVGGAVSTEIFLPVPQGESLLVALRAAVQDEFRICGDHHWGTITDCAAISERLDVGMLIFADNLQDNGTKCLANVDALRGNHAYYIALWWEDPVHFRLARYRESSSLPWHSFWAADDIPVSVRKHYNLCNPASHVGSARRIAVR